jgi:TPR repeat protein
MENMGGRQMAFTDVEVQEAREAVGAKADAADLFRLGLIYSTDHEDSGPNFIEAHKWFSLAAMMGNDAAKSYCMELKNEMTREDLTLAQRAARGWMFENKPAPEAVAA